MMRTLSRRVTVEAFECQSVSFAERGRSTSIEHSFLDDFGTLLDSEMSVAILELLAVS